MADDSLLIKLFSWIGWESNDDYGIETPGQGRENQMSFVHILQPFITPKNPHHRAAATCICNTVLFSLMGHFWWVVLPDELNIVMKRIAAYAQPRPLLLQINGERMGQ